MKAPLIILSLLLTSLTGGYPAELNKEVTTNGRTYLYGEINRAGLMTGQYKSWFDNAYAKYNLDKSVTDLIKAEHLEGITVKLLMGTWCGDSKRNVPVFFKFMDEIALKESHLQSWALDLRKQGPNQEHVKYQVRRVPTIIFYRDDVEIGRFIERPKPGERLEKLWVDILTQP